MAASEREDVNITAKRLIIEILELYQNLPCLWDTSHKLYCNKKARNQALDIILKKWKTGYPGANKDEVKKKIEHLRAGYRRERNKVKASKSSGSRLKDVYIPTLWYYPYLCFLHEKTNPKSEGIDNFSENSISDGEEPAMKKERNSILKQPKGYIKHQENLNNTAKQLVSGSSEGCSADAFGRSVSSQLKELPKLQRCLTEKLIGEVLFYAKLGELNLNTSINLNNNLHSSPSPLFVLPSPHHPSSSPQHMSPSPHHPSPSPQYPSQSPHHLSSSP